MSKVAVVGGGAAGMLAAAGAAQCGHDVTIYEKNDKLGKKLYITGKGRCNVTNSCDTEDFFKHVVTNPKFLYSAVYSFDNNAIMDFIENEGCELKTERGGRVFPVSDHSYDVINAIEHALRKLGVEIRLNSHVEDVIIKDNCIKGIVADGKNILSDSVIIATGGYSYPSTGSTGEGHAFAKKTGHNVKKGSPALVPFVSSDEWVKELQGLSLRNCGVTFWDGPKKIYEDFGELLFTHFGVSGPTVLSASSYAADIIKQRPLKLVMDLKPALDENKLDERILRDFDEFKNKKFANSLDKLFPKSLIPVIVFRSRIDSEKPVNGITREERKNLVHLIKNFDMTLTGLRGFNEAIITHGGVDVKDIDPGTMESRIIKNMYFAGEIIDVDAVTGGFNLQIAWSTGHLAGVSIK